MPVHDWSRVDAGIFHDFHQAWIITIRNALNAGLLPAGFSALADPRAAGAIPDILTLQRRGKAEGNESRHDGGVLTAPPQTSIVRKTDKEIYAARSNRIVIRHRLGTVVAAIEIVSPGNKGSRSALKTFVDKCVELMRRGVHQLLVDVLPPTPRDPGGIHKAIWDEVEEEPFNWPAGKSLTLVSYRAGIEKTAFIEPVGIGDRLPAMPIYLDADSYVMVPLESTYQATFAECPADMRELVETGRIANEDVDQWG